MTYTILSAGFANPEHTAAIVQTEEAGAIVASETDTPELWAAVLKVATPADYVAPSAHVPRSVAMWRARTIMKVTPWKGGTLFQAVQAAIAGLTDPLQKASAEEALERGDVFDRDGVFVPMLAGGLGLSDEQLDELMEQAAALPA